MHLNVINADKINLKVYTVHYISTLKGPESQTKPGHVIGYIFVNGLKTNQNKVN